MSAMFSGDILEFLSLLALTSYSMCAESKPRAGETSVVTSPELSGALRLQDALGESMSVVVSEDSKSGITLLFPAMPGTVTLNKSLPQLLRYRLHCARRSCDALILSEIRSYSAERHVFKYWINLSLDYFFFFLSQMDALS